MRKTQVLIVGAGPVGLTLAIDLAQQGIHCLLIDKKPGARVLAENGTVQRADHGNFPSYGVGRKNSGCGASR